MQRRHKVVHVITRLELGGAQQNTLFCTRNHDRSRFEVGLIAGRGGILDAEALTIPDARVDLVGYLKHPISPLWDLVALFRLRAQLVRSGADIVHTHSSKAGILGRLAAVLAGVPVVVHTVHGWSFNVTQPAWMQRMYAALERRAARWSDRLIVVSARDQAVGEERGIGDADQYRLLHSGIDCAAYRRPTRGRDEVRRELGVEPQHRLVGTLACLKPQKAPLDFVRAAAAAHARDPSLRFVIAGDGELRPAVEGLIRERGLDGVVRVLGWRHDVPDLLHALDVFLLTSLFEGLPRAVLQAMAAGTPVVATAVDGTPEVVLHRRTGLLVPASDPAAAASAVIEMATDEALARRCADEATRLLDESFEIEAMVRQLDGLYLSLLGQRARGARR